MLMKDATPLMPTSAWTIYQNNLQSMMAEEQKYT